MTAAGHPAANHREAPGGGRADSEPEFPQPWAIDPNHGMSVGPGYLGDAPHSLRTRELYRYYQPPRDACMLPPINTGNEYFPPGISATLHSSHDPILACLANLMARTLCAKRCIITMTGPGLSYVIAESTRTLSLRYPHTHAPGDELCIGAGTATSSIGGLCEHTISLLPPPAGSDEPFLLEIPDLRRHPKYYKAGYVRGWPHVRFYAGAPLRTENGVSIGTVCVMDDRPRPKGLNEEERAWMAELTDVIMGYLDTRREEEEGRRWRAAELELGRFIAEGFLDDRGEAKGMVERRDGRAWSARGLQERRRKETERRRRVEERRAAFQERMFAEMVRKERERESEKRESEERVRVRKRKQGGSEGVKTTVIRWDGMCVEQQQGSTEHAMELDANGKEAPPPARPDDPVLIAHARTSKRSPGIVQLATPEEEEGWDASVEDGMVDEGATEPSSLSLVDTIVLPPLPHNSAAASPCPAPSPASASPSYHSMSSDFITSSSNTNLTAASTAAGAPVRTIDTPSGGSLRKRRSNYEETASVEASFRATFSRAATLIRNAIDANVVFLDPDLEGIFNSPGTGEMLDPTSPLASPELTETATCISSSPTLESAARARRPAWLRRRTGVLAHATASGTSASLSHPASRIGSVQDLGFDMAALDEAVLADIVAENRDGGGIIAVGCGAYPGLDDDVRERTRTEEVLPRFLPGVRSAIVVPLVAEEGAPMPAGPGGVFAVAVVWTCDETRTFCEEVEGRFVVAIGRGITAEVGRLNVMNADKAKAEFISSISHELRTPLHGILASADFLADSPRLDAGQRSFVETIMSCASTLLETVNHVLQFQKLNSSVPLSDAATTMDPDGAVGLGVRGFRVGPTAESTTAAQVRANAAIPSTAETDLAAVVQDVAEGVCLGYSFKDVTQTAAHFADDHHGAIDSSGICGGGASTQNTGKDDVTVIIDIPPGDWTFNTNRASLRRIISNLVGNALKYNKPGGWVRVSLQSRKEVDTSGKARVTLTVADSGKGISREFLKTKLFTPFCQENPLSAGAGLGLSIVRQLVGILGGRIDVVSQLGVGTRVVVEMVVSTGATRVGAQEGAVGGVDQELALKTKGKRVRMFGFEDEETGAQDQEMMTEEDERPRGGVGLLKESLVGYAAGHYGMELVDAPGQEEIVIARDSKCAGVDEARKRGIPVVVLCARPPIAGTEEDHGNHMMTFLRKPFGPKKFTQAIRDCLEVSGSLKRASEALDPTAPALKRQALTARRLIQASEPVSPPQQQHISVPASPPPPNIPTLVPPHHKLADISPLCTNPHPDKPTILAVEDNPINMRLLTAFLAKKRYPFSTASDGLEALHRVTANRAIGGYDVILMDLQMPVLSGTECTREIRRLEARDAAFKRAYIVALTGLAAASDRHEAFTAGVDAFVVKPAKFGELERMWGEFLGRR
ncbi:hypothetical protein BDZ91DRAFT_852480 [Kalaharituber pfeilii]|nr:hypothetical protein BDZ91DRAFT_852480 [Kalaharituber pfeilii]